MALSIGSLYATIGLKDSGFASGLDKAVAHIKKTSDEVAALGAKLGIVALGFGAVGLAAIKASSDYAETSGKMQAVFGSSASDVDEWAKKSARSMSMGQQQARKFASDIGAIIAPMTGSQKAAADMSKHLVAVGSNMRAAFNSTNVEAIDAIKSGLTGEAEPLKRFGVIMLDGTLKAYAHAQGMKAVYEHMSIAEKTALRYSFILAQTKLIQGQAAKEAAGWGGQLELASGTVDDLAIALGGPLRAAFTPLLTAFNDVGAALISISPGIIELVAKIGLAVGVAAALGAAFLTVGGAIGTVLTFLPEIAAGFGFLATTILPVVAIMATLVVTVGLLYNAWQKVGDQIRDVVGDLGKEIGAAFLKSFGMLDTAASTAVGFVVDTLSLIPRAVYKMVDVALRGMQALVLKAKPFLEKLGLGDQASSMLGMISGARQGLTFDKSEFDDITASLKDALNPIALFKEAAAYWVNGDGAQALKGAGLALADGAKTGFVGAIDFISSLLGVDLHKLAAVMQNGKDQSLTTSPGLPGKHKESALDDILHYDIPAKTAPAVYNSFFDAVHSAMKDDQLWAGAAGNFAIGLADALHNALPGVISKSTADAFGSDTLDFLKTDKGQKTALAGAKGLDMILAGSFDLGSLGSAIGDAMVPGLGGVVGAAIGTGIQKVADTIKALASEIVDGITSMASQIGQIIFSGAKNASAIGGAVSQGAGFAGQALGVGAAAVALTAILADLAVGFVLLLPLLIPLAAIVGLLVVELAILAAPLVIIAGAFVALAGVAGLVVGFFVMLLQIGTMTKSFENFSLALEYGARQVIAAVEPLYAALMPVADVVLNFMIAFAAVAAGFIEILASLGVFEMLFEAARAAADAVLRFADMLLYGALQLLKVFANIADAVGMHDLAASLDAAQESIVGMRTALKGTIDHLDGLTASSASAEAANAAAAEKLLEAANAAGSLNLPEALKLAAARAGAVIPGVGDDNLLDTLSGHPARPVVNVFINGERISDIETPLDKRGKWKTFVQSGIAVSATAPRRHVTPKRGN